jgi:4'-phosphopantetheinyl transferase
MLLKPNEIHIWRIDDRDPSAAVDRLSRVLTPQEWERHDRFVSPKDRRRFLITRAMVREVLSRYRPDVAPSDWRFVFNDFGKPSIAEDQCDGQLHFNIAHTSGAIVLALRREPGIGIDVECLDRAIGGLSFFDSVFTEREIQSIRALPESRQARQFYTLWTLKEAYIKAIGMGLSIPLRGFGFDVDGADHPALYLCGYEDCNAADWRFRIWLAAPDHVMALAFRRSAATGEDVAIYRYAFA